jgi:hypothetical protein
MAKEKAVKKVGAATKAPKLEYNLEVQVNDLVYKGSAVSLEQAFSDFIKSPVFPFAVKTRALIKYGNGKKESQVVWPTFRARRQFKLMSLKPTTAELLAERFVSNLAQE